MLTEKDLNNLGEWIDDGVRYPWLAIGSYKLYNRDTENDNEFVIFNKFNNEVFPAFVAKTKEELSKMCYPFLGKDLDFSPKKDYSWEGVFSAMSVEQYKMCVEFFYSLLHFDLLTKKEKESIEAGFKLRIIIKEINEDFPSLNEYYYYPYISEDGNIDSLETMCKCNNIGCESIIGFHKLVDTNRPLLKQYFCSE